MQLALLLLHLLAVWYCKNIQSVSLKLIYNRR